MLQLTLKIPELWDESTLEFIPPREQTVQLEHSLISISKWESKWRKSFLRNVERTEEEFFDYVKCMTVSPQKVDPDFYRFLDRATRSKIIEYIDNTMTATTFRDAPKQGTATTGETITAELIYFWMIEYNIPVEFQKWHLNRLLTLIHVCELKNQPEQKMSRQDRARWQMELNAANRAKFHSKG